MVNKGGYISETNKLKIEDTNSVINTVNLLKHNLVKSILLNLMYSYATYG